MLSLPTVTLVAVDSLHTYLTLKALRHTMQQVNFKSAYLFTSDFTTKVSGLTVVPIPEVRTIEDYSRFILHTLPIYSPMFAEHILLIQFDGFVVNPDAWKDEFLDFDYIGAVWSDGKVGNGGFSLRSQKLLQILASRKEVIRQYHPEDVALGRLYRTFLEASGVRFAPPELAHQFSVEDNPYDNSFGYHGKQVEKNTGFSVECVDMNIDELYYRAKYLPSDTNEHVDTLHQLAKECDRIVEVGGNNGVATLAFLHAHPSLLLCYNTAHSPIYSVIEQLADQANISFRYSGMDSLSLNFDNIDLLYIDTKHTYQRVKSELNRHASSVNKYIVLHDTSTYGERGEDGSLGIGAAIQEFLGGSTEWKILKKCNNNNGLTILMRVRKQSTKLCYSGSIRSNDNYFIGIVIPVHNCLNYTIQTIDSVQTTHPYQIIVVDDKSQNETKEWLAQRSDIIAITDPPKSTGVAYNWNLGIKTAFDLGCTHVLVMNNDVILHPMAIDNMMSRFAQGDAVMVTGVDVSRDCESLQDFHRHKLDETITEEERPDFCAFLVNKKTIDEIGWFDTNFIGAYGEDNDYHARIAIANKVAVSISNAILYHYKSVTINDNTDRADIVDFSASNNDAYFKEKWGASPVDDVNEMRRRYWKHPYGDTTLTYRDWRGSDNYSPDEKAYE